MELTTSTDADRRPIVKFRNFRTVGEHYRAASQPPLGNGGESSAGGDNLTSKHAVGVAMEPQSRTIMKRVVANLKGGRESQVRRRWRMAMDQEDAAQEYVIK